MKEVVLNRNKIIQLMELMYLLNSSTNEQSSILIDKQVADIIGTSPAQIRYICNSVNYNPSKVK